MSGMMDRVTVDIIPAGERGSFRITDAQLMETDATSLQAFETLLLAEAERRGLRVEVAEEALTRDLLVRWRPETDDSGASNG